MSMHDEFERAISGSSEKKGMSALAWLFTSLGLFVVLGVVGVGFAMNRVAHKVEDMLVGFDYDAGAAADKVVARLESHADLLSADPEQGLAFLRGLEGDDPAQALVSGLFESPALHRHGHADLEILEKLESLEKLEGLEGLEALAELEDLADLKELKELKELKQLAEIREQDAGALHAHDGDVSVDLQRDHSGGSLVIRSDDGTVRLDLRRTDGGGSLVIDSDDGQARIDLQRTESGGFLTVDTDDGSVRFEVVRGDQGAQLLVDSDDGQSLRLSFGEAAQALPRWVPQLDGMPDQPRRIYSLNADQGTLGAVAWDQDVTAKAALDAFHAQLADAGYDIRAELRGNDTDYEEGSLWAKHPDSGRLVFVVAHETYEGTKLLVGYGEEIR